MLANTSTGKHLKYQPAFHMLVWSLAKRQCQHTRVAICSRGEGFTDEQGSSASSCGLVLVQPEYGPSTYTYAMQDISILKCCQLYRCSSKHTCTNLLSCSLPCECVLLLTCTGHTSTPSSSHSALRASSLHIESG